MDNSIEALRVPSPPSEYALAHIEVLQSSTSSATKREIEDCVRSVLRQTQKQAIYNNYVFQKCHFSNAYLKTHVEKITVLAAGHNANEKIILNNEFFCACRIHIYRTISDDPSVEELENTDEQSGNETVAAGRHWVLPNTEFEGLWENLIFDTDLKEQMLSYAETMLFFADRKVNPHIVTCNRMLLFHGPPGTGKTTLCKAIAQKLCIRLGDRYRSGRFLEVNSHSLFSKWFSESGKLVTKMFAKIHELLEDESSLLIVLIDEVESLTVARRQALSGNEPSDAVRVVNALLTQIDYIRRWPNVLVLTTSNIAEAVDPAFLDRADIKQYIGPPSASAIYSIFYESILELRRAGIISSTITLLPTAVNKMGGDEQESVVLSRKLLQISQQCSGFSGRTIRKLPLLAHAYRLAMNRPVTLEDFIEALAFAAAKHLENTQRCSENEEIIPVTDDSLTLSPTRNANLA